MTKIIVWLLFLSPPGQDQGYSQQPFTYSTLRECVIVATEVKHKDGASLCLPATVYVGVK